MLARTLQRVLDAVKRSVAVRLARAARRDDLSRKKRRKEKALASAGARVAPTERAETALPKLHREEQARRAASVARTEPPDVPEPDPRLEDHAPAATDAPARRAFTLNGVVARMLLLMGLLLAAEVVFSLPLRVEHDPPIMLYLAYAI